MLLSLNRRIVSQSQLSGAGVVLLVKMIGWPLVPSAINLPPPWTINSMPLLNLTVTPGEIVKVPDITVTVPVTMIGLSAVVQTVSVRIMPETSLANGAALTGKAMPAKRINKPHTIAKPTVATAAALSTRAPYLWASISVLLLLTLAGELNHGTTQPPL